MSIEFMGDPYEAQLRAAKAEGELARIKDALREFAEENGLNPELEPRDLLAKATGSFRSCAAMSDARYTEIRELKAEMEAMRPRLMPEGMEWPCFDDGEPVRIGDEAPFGSDGRMVVTGIELVEGGFVLHGRDGGIERPCQTGYKVGVRVKRPAPKVLDADGVEICVGDRLYDTDTGCERTVRAVNDNGTVEFDGHENRGWFGWFLTHRAPVLAADGGPLREGETVYLTDSTTAFVVDDIMTREDGSTVVHLAGGAWHRPQDLTHERPVLDAGGVPIRKGDTVWCVATDEELTDMSIIRACWSKMRKKLTVESFITDAHGDKWAGFEETSPYVKTCYLTHERPDSWKRIEEDAEKDPCSYFGFDGEETCGKCPASGKNCEQTMALDLVRRARALAEKED